MHKPLVGFFVLAIVSLAGVLEHAIIHFGAVTTFDSLPASTGTSCAIPTAGMLINTRSSATAVLPWAAMTPCFTAGGLPLYPKTSEVPADAKDAFLSRLPAGPDLEEVNVHWTSDPLATLKDFYSFAMRANGWVHQGNMEWQQDGTSGILTGFYSDASLKERVIVMLVPMGELAGSASLADANIPQNSTAIITLLGH